MRNLIVCLILFLTCISSCKSQSNKLTVISNGRSEYRIYTPKNPSEFDRRAAQELQKYIYQVYAVQLPITFESNTAGLGIYLGATEKLKNNLSLFKGIKDDGFLIRIKNRNIYIAGVKNKGSLYGVYKFLERFVGVEKFAPDLISIPKRKTLLSVPANFELLSNPAFLMRDVFNDISYDENMTDWFCLTHMYKEPSMWGLKGHTFFQLIPPKKYFKSNPKLFSLINGKRKASQLCLSNIQVRRIICENLKSLINKSPNKKYWMVGQEDVGSFCQCESCKKLYKKYGGISGALLNFVNTIAAEFPDKIIGTFAYHETLSPPKDKNIKAASNVLVCYAPIEAYHEESYANSSDKRFVLYLKDWSSIVSHLMVWDYIGDFNNMLLPYPNISTFANNIKLFKDNNVELVYEEGVNKKGGNLKELKTYVLSKLLWNPEENVDTLIDNFCKHYYGAASSYVIEYINALTKNMKKNNDRLRFWGGTHRYLDNSCIKEYDDILNRASQAVSTNKVLMGRINMIRLGVDMAFLRNNMNSSGVNKIKLFSSKSDNPIRIKRIKDVANQNGINWIMAGGKWNTIDKELLKFNK